MRIDSQREDIQNLAFENWDLVTIAVLPVRRTSAHEQMNIAGQPISSGKERDTESGNDYFGARDYAGTMAQQLC